MRSRVRRVADRHDGAVGPLGVDVGTVRTKPSPVGRSCATGEVDVAVVLDLLDAASACGASVPHALDLVGRAIGGTRGTALAGVAVELGLGAPWSEAWSGTSPSLTPVRVTLRPAWEDGTAAAGSLRAAADQLRRARHGAALEAAARLGVRLVLPLGLCFLPAFVLVGLVPVLVSMAQGSLLP